MATRAVIYCRISLASMGDTTKTDDQERLCREVCDRRGWTVAGVFTDNSKSAWRRGLRRPGWDAMLAAIRDGKCDAIVTYWGDRLVRQPRDLEDLLDLREGAAGISLASVAGQYDFDNREHRMMMRWEVARACNESDGISDRKRAQYDRWRREGRVRPGGRRAFGFAADGITHDPGEAAIVSELARRVLAGESVGSLVRDLNARGIATTTGKPFSHTALRSMLERPRLAGLMPDGVSPAAWQPLLEREDWERLRAVLDGRYAGDRPPGIGPDNARKYLLSGIAECGVCGAGLSIHLTRHRNGRTARSYSCKACRKIGRSQPLLDAFVTGRVLARLANPANPQPSADGTAASAALATLTARRAETVAVIEQLADHPGQSPAVLARALDSFDKRIAELRDQAADGGRARLLAAHAGISPAEFEALDLTARRALIAACYRIIIKPVTRRGRGFDPADILMSPL